MKLINKPVVLLVFSLVLLLSIGSVCASEDIGVSDIDNSDLGVSSLSEVPVDDNNVNNLGANPGSFSDLQTLIDDTSAGATLDLSDDYSFNQNTDDDEGISITKDITINGNGHTLDGKNLARIFIMENSAVTINNLNFVNANVKYDYDSGSGGAIYSDGVDLTLNGCTFENNTGYYGAAIDCEEGSICISNCDFINNWANYYGGAIYAYDNPKLIINNCSFVDNTADDEDGGAIECEYTNLELIDSTFINNVAGDGGGAIDCYTDSAYYEYTVSIIKCNFSNNVAGDGGGAIYFEEMETNISDSSFINNSADNGGALYFNGFPSYDSPAYIMNSIFSSNYAEENGGAIDFNGQDTFSYVINSTFVYNEADNGGAIFGSQENGVVTENSTYVLNSANTNGGAIYFDCDYEENYVNSCTFLGNSAEYGGAIYNTGYVHDIIHSIFDGNNATCAKDLYNDVFIMYFLGKYNENYWSMNFTSVDEFVKAGLVYQTSYEDTFNKIKYVVDDYVAPDNWVLMSIYAPDELKVGVSAPIVVKLDKLTDGSSISDFTGSLPDYYTSAYAFTKSENDNYNYKWDNENPDVGSYIGNLWIRNGEGSFNFTAPASGEYVFRTHSPFTIWEEAVTKLTTARLYNMSITESTLNKTVYVGNQTEFLIVVNNTGDSNLTGVYVVEKSSDDMVYDSWRPVSGNWVYSFVDGVHRWTLDGSLAPNETASFILVFNTTSVGNKTNIVLGGSNELDNLSAENVTEVINKTNPNPDPNPDPTPTPEPNPVPGNGGSDSVVSKMVSTGNPLALIIISLFTIFVGGLKRKI